MVCSEAARGRSGLRLRPTPWPRPSGRWTLLGAHRHLDFWGEKKHALSGTTPPLTEMPSGDLSGLRRRQTVIFSHFGSYVRSVAQDISKR
eukprot:1536528-Prymnesium_polylepis.1